MSKYAPLSEYLAASGLESVTLTFKEIEAILGFPLPKSARYRAFWENSEKSIHVQNKAWLSAGYTTKVKLAKSIILFQKTASAPLNTVKSDTSKPFEDLAREALSAYYGVPLRHRKREGWAKLFDLVSEDYQIVGDLICLTMGGASKLPPARASIISELAWMLEKTGAPKVFIAFGKDRRVPHEWLRRYGHLTGAVNFYFLSDNGEIEQLK